MSLTVMGDDYTKYNSGIRSSFAFDLWDQRSKLFWFVRLFKYVAQPGVLLSLIQWDLAVATNLNKPYEAPLRMIHTNRTQSKHRVCKLSGKAFSQTKNEAFTLDLVHQASWTVCFWTDLIIEQVRSMCNSKSARFLRFFFFVIFRSFLF